MKYRAGLPDEAVNLPRRNVLLQALKLSLSLAVIAAAAFGLLSLAMNAAVAYITPEQEQMLMRKIGSDMNLTGTENSELDRVTAKLAACTSLPYKVKAYLFESETPNAFAVPGGYIFVSTGLAEGVKNENELAFILGHELGHFKHKDHLRRLGYGLILSTVAMMLGDTASFGFDSALDFGNASYSRSAERAADLYGLEAMQCAYGSVTDATAFFERMAETEHWNGFMADHPGFKERIAAMKAEMAVKKMDTATPPVALEADAFRGETFSE